MLPLPDRELTLRILSAVVLMAVAALFIHLGGIPYSLFLTVVALIAMIEWHNLSLSEVGRFAYGLTFVGLIVAIPAAGALGVAMALTLIVSFAVAIGLMMAPDYTFDKFLALFGFIYIGTAAAVLNALRHITDRLAIEGTGVLWPTILLLILVVITDSGAYFSGKKFGKHKLVPLVSPSKTWEGLFGGVISAFIFAALFYFTLPATLVPWWGILVLGLLLPVVAQAGDIGVSWLKRRRGIKDSGKIIPGHGGVLDRIDGLMAATLFFYIWFWLFIQT